MMLKNRLTAALVVTFFAQTALACDEPAAISIPDGGAASEKEMTAAGQAYHQFMIGMQLYQVCLEDEANQDRLAADDLGKAQIKAQENRFASLHNSASAAMESTTERFEEAVSDYKAR